MQGLRRCSNDVVRLDLRPASASSSSLSIDEAESAETRIRRLISEHPVIIFSRTSCYMCHVMKKLLLTIGVHPTVIELEDDEIQALPSSPDASTPSNPAPAVFIDGSCIGGLESLVALHLSGHLVPKLVEIGALWKDSEEDNFSISGWYDVKTCKLYLPEDLADHKKNSPQVNSVHAHQVLVGPFPNY